MTLGEEIPVENNGYVFVEGAYSCHPVFGDYMDRRVFLDIDGKTQEERIRKRNGEDRLQDFYSCGSRWKRHTFRHSLCGKSRLHFIIEEINERRDICCSSFTRIMRRIPPMA